jgi:poly [ADP-ribose] polymerase 2/3/4
MGDVMKLKNVPRPEKAIRTIHLIKVEGQNGNNNKYYDMYDTGDGNFIVFFGRVGADPQIEQYPISRWDSKYREKLSDRKGYKDITHLKVDDSAIQQFVGVSDTAVAKLVADLQKYANNLIQQTYLVGAGAVTLTQIEEAQRVLDLLVAYITDPSYVNLHGDLYVRKVNDVLTKLFTVIPRKMKLVSDHLLSQKDESALKRIIDDEQSSLDAMEGQVKALQLQKTSIDTSSTILDAMGIKISSIDDNEKNRLKRMLGGDSNLFRSAFSVINVKTQERFDKWLDGAPDKKVMELFHGSRNANWWSILGSGLMIKPTNAVHTGSMFGNACYFASLAKKSIGYTSLSGSYWARGSENKAYLAVFNVHVGKQYVVDSHEHEHYSFDYNKLRRKGSYDSMHAKAGRSLYNDEFMVYKIEQATVRNLIEIAR